MNSLALGRVRVEAVVETAGPTRPTWLFPAATPEALARHREWLAPHFIDAEGRLLQSVHTFVVKTPASPPSSTPASGTTRTAAAAALPHDPDQISSRSPRRRFPGVGRRGDLHPSARRPRRLEHPAGRWALGAHLSPRPPPLRAARVGALDDRGGRRHESHPGRQRGTGPGRGPRHPGGGGPPGSDGLWLEPTPGHTPGHVSVRLSPGTARPSSRATSCITPSRSPSPAGVPSTPNRGAGPGDAARVLRALCGRADHRARHPLQPSDRGRILRHGDAWRFVVAEPR